MPLTEAQLVEMFANVAVLKAESKNVSREMEQLAGRVRTLETRGIGGGSDGRRLRDRALPLGRDGLLVALMAEVAYRAVTGG